MSNLFEALSNARSNLVRDDYADRVKALVHEHLRALEPAAKIEDTKYFNHSAIPDFKLTWDQRNGVRAQRDVFIRASYASVIAADETGYFQSGDPIFLALDSNVEVNEKGFHISREDLSAAVQDTERTLLTDAAAFDEIASNHGDAESPISSAIRNNFLNGARGLVDEPVASALTGPQLTENSPEIIDLVRANFVEDAVLRMERTATLVDWALDTERELTAEELKKLEGRMTTDELSAYLPWLLSRAEEQRDVLFWSTLGGLFDVELLEGIADSLEGMDLTDLVNANLRTWSARRGYLGLNIDADELVGATWKMVQGTLAYGIGERLIRVSNSGNKLKARPSTHSPQWERVRPRLENFSLKGITLTGLERNVTLSAKQSDDINLDIGKIVETVSDDYFVESVEVLIDAVPGAEPALEPVAIDFPGAIAIADMPVQLGSLIETTAKLIGDFDPELPS